MTRKISPGAFTLIELLVVVAIIAILASIAVVNFLEAQTRAKVSRVKNDMRTIATALEAYMIDNNRYPPNYDTGFYGHSPGSEYMTFSALTTPVAFISSAPDDIFRPDPNEPGRGRYFDYVGADTVLVMDHYSPLLKHYYGVTGTRWSVSSTGPDQDHQDSGQNLHQIILLTYDPTNGTVSAGDIMRSNLGQFGG